MKAVGIFHVLMGVVFLAAASLSPHSSLDVILIVGGIFLIVHGSTRWVS